MWHRPNRENHLLSELRRPSLVPKSTPTSSLPVKTEISSIQIVPPFSPNPASGEVSLDPLQPMSTRCKGGSNTPLLFP